MMTRSRFTWPIVMVAAVALLVGAVGCDDDFEEMFEDAVFNIGGWGHNDGCSSCGGDYYYEDYYYEDYYEDDWGWW